MRLDPFENILRKAIGLKPSTLGETALGRAVSAAMARSGAKSPEEYLDLLTASAKGRGDPAILDDLIREAVVPETWFFRDKAPFRCLRQRLSTLKDSAKPPRILSAPCATGEEAYSIAITCLEAGLRPDEFYLKAADVSPDALETASRGRYGRHSFREDIGPHMRYFTSREDGGPDGVFAVKPEVAATVQFTRSNIVSRDFLAEEKPFDVIFSRNLLIYLHEDARKQLIANFGRLLAKDGLLFAGHAELAFFISEGFCSAQYPGAFACRWVGPADAAPKKHNGSPASAPASRPRPERHNSQATGAAKLVQPQPPLGKTAAHSPTSRNVPGQTPPADATSMGKNIAKESAPDGDLLDKARNLADMGAFFEAADLCRRHLKNDRHSAEAYYLLGLVGAAEQRVDEARALFQKALYLDPAHAPSLTHLALIHEQLGDATKAELYRQRLRRLTESARGEP